MTKNNASDEQIVESLQEDEKNERIKYLQDLKFILNTPQGERFFKKFVELGYIFRTTFTGNSKTFFLEGHRNLALSIFNDICEADPNIVPKLMINQEKKEED